MSAKPRSTLRFDRHKTGYKASQYVNRFGVRLLPQLFEHFNPLRRWEAVELEPALAEAFRRAVGGGWAQMAVAAGVQLRAKGRCC